MRCKHYHPDMKLIKEDCKALYDIDECVCGGYLHILLDDDNFGLDHILFCYKECLRHIDEPGSELGLRICTDYMNMTVEQRAVFDSYWNGQSMECEHGHKWRLSWYLR